jgi:hypothetical protein
MIELPRALARDFRAVLRRTLADVAPRGPLPPVLCRSGPAGQSLHAGLGELAVRHHRAGAFPVVELAFPGAVLASFEGASTLPVTLEEIQPGRGRARWDEGGSARAAEFPTISVDGVAPFPDLPATWTPLPDGFVAAFGEAALTTADQDGGRLSLARVQLRGRAGEVIASDGRQLLLQAGFPQPWEGDLIVSRQPAFAGRLLAGVTPVAIGRTETRVAIQAGPWTFTLPIDAKARYPDVRGVIPRPSDRSTRLRLDPEDAVLLIKALPGLPGKNDDLSPVTIDLESRPAVRARAESGDAAEEVVLVRSSVTGPPVRVVTDRRYLLRAVRLGFKEIEIGPGDRPLVCRDGQRTYLWMQLSHKPALPSQSVPRTPEPTVPSAVSPESIPEPTRRITTMSRSVPANNGSTPRNGIAANPQSSGLPEVDLDGLLAEGEALRSLLHEAHARLGRLLAGLKHHRRQAKAVETALASLRPFQRVAGGAP